MPTLDTDEARRRFADARGARLATVGSDGHPHLVPVVFAVDHSDGDVVLVAVDQKPKRHRRLRRLDNIAANPAVSLLADEYSDDWLRLWWVRADGTARVDDGSATVVRAQQLLGARYRQHRDDPPGGPVIVIEIGRWSGWSAT